MEEQLQDLVSVPEAARRAGVARNTMRLAARNGTIRAVKPGRNWLIFASDIDRWKREVYRPDMALRNPPKQETDAGDDAP
ncbi:MAG: helix-turn-helix domain-containing protein [Anaerolineae bacterium]|nr:helix-turn-helix domain-containing protein [Anaerolineae bacterium]